MKCFFNHVVIVKLGIALIIAAGLIIILNVIPPDGILSYSYERYVIEPFEYHVYLESSENEYRFLVLEKDGKTDLKILNSNECDLVEFECCTSPHLQISREPYRSILDEWISELFKSPVDKALLGLSDNKGEIAKITLYVPKGMIKLG